MSVSLKQWLNETQDEIIAVPIEERTIRFTCGVCGILIKSKDAEYSYCNRGHLNKVVKH